MTTYLIFIAIIAAFSLGGAFGVLIMCVFAINRVGEDPLPEISQSPIPRQHVQD